MLHVHCLIFWCQYSALSNYHTIWKDNLIFIYSGARIGEQNGLRMLLDAEVFDHGPGQAISQVHSSIKLTISDYFIIFFQGFNVGAMHYLDVPLMAQKGLNIGLGKDTQMAITPELIYTTQVARARFTPEQRKCFFGVISL